MPTMTDEKMTGDRVRLIISIPDDVFATYEKQAEAKSTSVERLITERLSRCRDHIANQPIYLDDDARRELTHITGGHLLMNASDVLQRVRNTCRVKFGEVALDIEQRLMERLSSRASAERRPVEVIIKREALRGLRQFCQMD